MEKKCSKSLNFLKIITKLNSSLDNNLVNKFLSDSTIVKAALIKH